MTDAFDRLDDEVAEGARSPVSGITSAMQAGEALATDVLHPDAPEAGATAPAIAGPRREMTSYLLVQASWFAAFGLQMVLFPHLIVNVLQENAARLGLAQMALSLPSLVFILFGGVLAERADGRVLLIVLHGVAAIPPALLAWWALDEQVAFGVLIAYALVMGTVGAFMMPARDAILNEVVARRSAAGSRLTLQQGVALASLTQFGAQIIGLGLGGFAGRVDESVLLGVQAAVVGIGALAALMLGRGQMVRTGRKGLGAAFGDIADGFRAVAGNSLLWPMTMSMVGVGVFVIGSFLVVLPIINRDVYGLGADGIRNMFITFWFGAFVSSVALSRFRGVKRPGRVLLIAQLLGSLCILFLVRQVPYPLFLTVVFVWGLAAGVSITLSRTIVQEAAPPAQLARVLSIYQLGFMGGAPIGAALMGFIAATFGAAVTPLVPALGMTVIIVWLAFGSPLWRLRR
jgi:MFS family permease